MTNQMSYPYPYFSPLISNKIEGNKKQPLLLVILIGNFTYYIIGLMKLFGSYEEQLTLSWSFIMRDITLKNVDGWTNYLKTIHEIFDF